MCTSDIFCVTNRRLCREDFLKRIEKIAACRPAGIILREKDMLPEEYSRLAGNIMEICETFKVRCILHSFCDTALSLGAEGFHMPLRLLREMDPEVRRRFPVLGASCHSPVEAEEAMKLGCSYITAGHIFATDCKRGLPGRGPEFLAEVCRTVDIPVYGIGGISPENIRAVRAAGAAGACLMSSLMTAEDVPTLMKAMEVKPDR